jgi:hypothetical protein
VIDSLETRQICRVALNGMMSKGLSSVFNYMFTQILKKHLQFTSAGQLRQRNITLLRVHKCNLVEPQIVEVIDTKVLVLDKILTKLKQASMTSALDFIKSLLNDFILGYLVVLTLSLWAILWWSLVVIKRNMWDTNIILKILPIETLSKAEREEIKNFFKA